MTEPTRGLLGRLPPEPERPRLAFAPLAGLPTPPPEVHNLELIPDSDMLGNDKWGDCVFAAIENDRRASRAALGLPLNKVGAAQIVATYKAYTGATVPPGPGAVVQRALEWVRRNGWPGSTDRLLAFGDPRVGILPIDQTVAEFHSAIFGSDIHTAQTYPARTWDYVPASPYEGGHATAGGTYTPVYTGTKTWGYIAAMTPAYVAHEMGEVWALVWDFEWQALSYERQLEIISNLAALTADPWNGPAPVAPIVLEGIPVIPNLLAKPVRIFDGSIPGRTAVTIPVPGLPAGAIGVSLAVRVVRPTVTRWVYVGPPAGAPPATPEKDMVSTLDYNAGLTDNGYPDALLTDGALTVYSPDPIARLVLDTTSYFTAA